MVSVHRRRLAASKLGLEAVPVLVREMSDDEAVILMVDSNLQREHLLPSEKAFAYKMKLEAINRQKGRPKSGQVVPDYHGKRSTEVLGEVIGESYKQVQRYIRLTNLVPPLLKLVDEGRIAFSPAVELSYLTKEEQAELWDLIEQEDATPSLSQAIRHPFRGKAQSKGAGPYQNGVAEKVFSQPLQHAADGKGHPEAVGGPLPQQTPWAGAVVSYTGAIQTCPLH